MIHLYGGQLADEDAQQLVALLRAEGSADALAAANAIASALVSQRSLVKITPEMRHALMRVLIILPEALVDLRKRLERSTVVGRDW